jgi:uncharacterized protein
MSGMNGHTGRAIDGLAHLRQRIADILFTPVGTRVERRTYGSLLPELIDQPDNATTRVRLYSAVAGALMLWEPRLRLARVQLLSGPQPGQSEIQIDGLYAPQQGAGQALVMRLPLQLRAAL